MPDSVADLLAAWYATHYDIRLPQGRTVTLRIGQPLPAVACEWLRTDPFGVFVTACNPRSQRLPEAENAARLATLRLGLGALACRMVEGVGHAPDDDWSEPGLFVAGLDLATVDALARTLAQDAIVLAPAQGAVRLRLYRGEWRATLAEAASIDWA